VDSNRGCLLQSQLMLRARVMMKVDKMVTLGPLARNSWCFQTSLSRPVRRLSTYID
jgi:hypothetical protein